MTPVPLHGIRDLSKFAAIVESFRVGVPVPPIAACGETALSGSHRIAAYDSARRSWNALEDGWEDTPEPKLTIIDVSEDDFLAACRILNVGSHDEVEHFDLFSAALYRVTEDENLKAALADQRGDYKGCDESYFAWYADSR